MTSRLADPVPLPPRPSGGTSVAQEARSSQGAPGESAGGPQAPIETMLDGRLPGKVHLLGAGGAGVSGVGRLLHARGVRVSGHDARSSALLDGLAALGAELHLGDSRAEHLPADAELVVRSAAVPATDPQVVAAAERGLRVMKYAEVLPLFAPARRLAAVAGTHGKTTVSWMLWHALEAVGEELGGPVPGALVGGTCRRLGTNALVGGRGAWFCVEACEYDRSFHHLAPQAAVVTNVDADHLDYYGTLEAIHEAFAGFVAAVPHAGALVLGANVPAAVEAAAGAPVLRLGRELEVELLGEDRGAFQFLVNAPAWTTPPITLAVPGHFNVDNAALALTLAIEVGRRAPESDPQAVAAAAARGVERFFGVQRRFEPWGCEHDVDVVHDYAHHPAEVAVTLETARRAFPGRRLHVLFQPHQHSRTARFLDEFAESLRGADRVVVADVYGARLHVDGERTAGAPELVNALLRRRCDAVLGGPLDEAARRFAAGLGGGEAAFVLGAGDVETIRDDLLRTLALRGAPAG